MLPSGDDGSDGWYMGRFRSMRRLGWSRRTHLQREADADSAAQAQTLAELLARIEADRAELWPAATGARLMALNASLVLLPSPIEKAGRPASSQWRGFAANAVAAAISSSPHESSADHGGRASTFCDVSPRVHSGESRSLPR